MEGLTVGEVAGLMNIAFLFFQFTLPILQIIILLGFLRPGNSAATWTVVSRAIQGTHLPTLVRSDATAGRKEGLTGRVAFLSYFSIFTSLLVASAAVVSPLGLVSSTVNQRLVQSTFQFAADPSVFTDGTPPRDLYKISRSCGLSMIPCPGLGPGDLLNLTAYNYTYPDMPIDNYTLPQNANYTFTVLPDGTEITNVTTSNGTYSMVTNSSAASADPTENVIPLYSSRVPQEIVHLFRSGTMSPNDYRHDPFEVQFRTYWTSRPMPGNASYANTTGDLEYIQQVTLSAGYHLIEGLIVDAHDGGIGFRNHTVPIQPRMDFGGTWSEDLLWINPLTSCIPTNWTFESTRQMTPFTSSPQSFVKDVKLVRNGALASHDVAAYGELQLAQRLWKAARDLDANILVYYGTSNSSTRVDNSTGTPEITLQNSTTMADYSDPFWNLLFSISNGFILDSVWDPTDYGAAQYSGSDADPLLYHIMRDCRNYTIKSAPSIDLPFVECGILIPEPTQSQNSQDADLDQFVSQPIYICATGIAASVKEVQFLYTDFDGSQNLSGLEVVRVEPKNYTSSGEIPLWGVEDPGGNWTLGQIQLLWGIVDPGVAASSNNKIRTRKNESLFLPSFVYNGISGTGYADSMGASRGPGLALSMTYQIGAIEANGLSGYSQTPDFATRQRWSSLMATPDKIPSLQWTDLAANMLVGTRSRLGSSPSASSSATQLGQVLKAERGVSYKYQYGVLGFLCCAVWIGCAALCIVMLRFSSFRYAISLSRVKALTNVLSVGRSMACMVVPEMKADSMTLPSAEWLKEAGRTRIVVLGDDDEVLMADSVWD